MTTLLLAGSYSEVTRIMESRREWDEEAYQILEAIQASLAARIVYSLIERGREIELTDAMGQVHFEMPFAEEHCAECGFKSRWHQPHTSIDCPKEPNSSYTDRRPRY